MMQFRFLFLLVISVYSAHAQTLKQGSIYAPERDMGLLRVLGRIGDDCWVARARVDKNSDLPEDILLESFDAISLDPKGSFRLDAVYKNKQIDYPEGIFIWNKRVCLFSSSFSKGQKTYSLIKREVDAQGNLGPNQVMMTCPTDEFVFNQKRFHISISPSGEVASMVHISKLPKENGNIRVHLNLFDSEGAALRTTTIDLAFPVENVECSSLITDDRGNVHLLLKGKKGDQTIYSLFAFPVFGDDVVEYALEIPGKSISSLDLGINSEERIIVSGLFHENFEPSWKVNGLFYLRVDRESGTVEANGIYRFDTDLLGLYSGENEKQEREQFNHFRVVSLLPSKANSATLVAEYFKQEEVCEADYRTGIMMCYQAYSCDKTLLVQLNEQGATDWYLTLPQKQYSVDDDGRYLGVYPFLNSKNGTSLLYNGLSEKESQRDSLSRVEVFSRSSEVIVPLSSSGQANAIQYPSEVSLPIVVTSVHHEVDGSAYFIAEVNGKAALVRLKP